MKTNWNKAVNEINRKRYMIPKGWDSRDVVAEQLGCPPERVGELLRAGIQSGEIERQEFPVWDEAKKTTVKILCYKLVSDKGNETESVPCTVSSNLSDEDQKRRERVVRALERDSSYDDYRISRNARAAVSFVRQIRAEMGL